MKGHELKRHLKWITGSIIVYLLLHKAIEYVLGNIKNIAERETIEPWSVVLKANELLGKHLKIFHDGEMDVTLKEHRDTLRQLEELE